MERAVINKDTVIDFTRQVEPLAVTEFTYGELTWRNRDRFVGGENEILACME